MCTIIIDSFIRNNRKIIILSFDNSPTSDSNGMNFDIS